MSEAQNKYRRVENLLEMSNIVPPAMSLHLDPWALLFHVHPSIDKAELTLVDSICKKLKFLF